MTTAPHRAVVNIRGANASGKTTLVRHLLAARTMGNLNYDVGPFPDATGALCKVKISSVVLPQLILPVYVLGTYDDSKYSGCDKIKSADVIENALRWMIEHSESHIVFEGFRVSKSWTRFAAVRNWAVKTQSAPKWVWVFLRAPQELIFERSAARRNENARPIDKNELAAVCRVMESTRRKAKLAFPHEVLDLDAALPTEQLYAQLIDRMAAVEQL